MICCVLAAMLFGRLARGLVFIVRRIRQGGGRGAAESPHPAPKISFGRVSQESVPGQDGVHFALESPAGLRYMVEELLTAGITQRLADPTHGPRSSLRPLRNTTAPLRTRDGPAPGVPAPNESFPRNPHAAAPVARGAEELVTPTE